MKIKLSGLFLSFVVFFLLFLSVPFKNALAANVNLSGKISDSSANNISGATIDVYNPGTTTDVVPNVTSDSSGNYQVNVPTGTFDIKVTPPGSTYSPAIALSQSITSDTVLNFILVPTGSVTLSGHIYGPSNDPLKTVDVQLSGNSSSGFTQTNTLGAYSVQVSPSSYTLSGECDRANYIDMPNACQYTTSFHALSLNQSTILDLTFPAKKVVVHVQDSSGNPVSNVAVTTGNHPTSTVTLPSGLQVNVTNGWNNYGGVTDASGNETIWLLPQTYSLTATPPSGSGFPTTTVSNISVTGDTNTTITLPTPVTLSGHIYGPSGDPLKTVDVQLTGNSSSAFTQTDNNGFYSVQVLPGSYTMRGECDRANYTDMPNACQYATSTISLLQNTTLDISFPAKKVSVHVQDVNGNPVSNIAITTNNHPNSSFSLLNGIQVTVTNGWNNYGAVTDSFGNEIIWLLPQTYGLTATPPSGSGYPVTTVSNVSVTRDTSQTITLPTPVTLSGHIYGPSRDALKSVEVQLVGDSSTADVLTDTNGFYSTQVLAGSYTLSGRCDRANYTDMPDGCSYSSSFHALSLMQNTTLDITFPAKKITAHVQDVGGNPLSNIKISSSNATNIITLTNGLQISVLNNWIDYSSGTDNSGNETLWLLPQTYNFTATPPSGSIYTQFTLNNISINSDQTEIISLQFNHAHPVTTATLSPAADGQGNYSDPTMVTLSATAASGYSIANTYYTIDGGTQQTYTVPFAVSGGGNHTITYWSIDNSEVFESPNVKTFTIHTNQTPVINTIANATINEGDTYNVSGSFTDGDSTSWTATVDYGDGTGSQPLSLSGQNFSLNHTYGVTGVYTLTVSVTDNQGATGTKTATITVGNVAPIVGAIDAPTSPVEPGDAVTIDANFTDPGSSDSFTSTIDWGDGSTTNGTITLGSSTDSVSGTHTYTDPGIYNVTLTVTDDNGASTTSTTQIVVNAPPTAQVNGPYIVAEGSDVTVSGSGTDPDGDLLTYAWDLDNNGSYETSGQSILFQGIDGPATKIVGFQVCDTFGACATDTAMVTVTNVNPTVNTIVITPSQPQENQAITTTAGFTDPGVLDTHTAMWDWGDGSVAQNGTVTENNGSGSISDTHTYATYGNYTITLTVTDKDGGVATQTQQIFVNAPPVANAGGPYYIAEGGSMPLQGSATDVDDDNLTYTWDLTGGTNFTTTGQTQIFLDTIDGPSTKIVNLQVCDNHNACSTSQAIVNIFNVAPTIGVITAPTTPQAVNTTITASATFTDPGVLDTHTAVWNWGDGNTSQGTANEINGSGSISNSHTYTIAGVYTIQLTVTDKDGGSGTNYYQYVVVYDPTAGFITGSGIINSPAGALTAETSITGNATFGISAKYTGNNTTPTGNLMYNFSAGGFEFASTSYDWLVVKGSTAFLHGYGTINGGGNYTFLLSAVDGSPDTLRIKVFDSNNNIIYDNQMGDSDTMPASEAITHGQIQVH